MPIYEYRCPQCGEKFEELRSIHKGKSARCPECNRRAYRVPSQFSFDFGNPFPKRGNVAGDGEGFTSEVMSRQEANERARANAHKED